MCQAPTVGPLNINAIKYLNTLIYVYIACAFSLAPVVLTFNGEWIFKTSALCKLILFLNPEPSPLHPCPK